MRGKLDLDYTIVIPAFNCASGLRQLIREIWSVNGERNGSILPFGYLPKQILIVDDSSTDDGETGFVSSMGSSETIPVSTIVTPYQMGPCGATDFGLKNVTTQYAVVMDSDTTLIPEEKRVQMASRKEPAITVALNNVMSDAISVMICYLDKQRKLEKVGAIGCHILAKEFPNSVFGGRVSIGSNGLPYTPYERFHFARLFITPQERWQRVHALDGRMFVLNMDAYRDIGSLDDCFGSYLYYYPDFFGKIRLEGYHIYMTQDVIAFHSAYQSHKPEGSLAKFDKDDYEKAKDIWIRRWGHSHIWRNNTLYATAMEEIIK